MYKDLFALQTVEMAQRAVETAEKESDAYQRMLQCKKDFDRKKVQYMENEEDLASLKEQLEAFPAQLEEIKEKLLEEQNAMYDGSVGNMKEMTARENQAAALEDKIQELEALTSLYTGEKAQKEQLQRKIKLDMARDHAGFKAAKEEYENLLAADEQKLKKLRAEREKLVKILDPEQLDWYDRVKHKCGGTPIAKLGADQVCGGCFTIVPPVIYHRATNGQKTYCEKCGRVLFVESIPE